MMKKLWILASAALFFTSCNAKPADNVPVETNEPAAAAELNDKAPKVEAAAEDIKPDEAPVKADTPVDAVVQRSQKLMENGQFDDALRIIYEAEIEYGPQESLETAYKKAISDHPSLHAEPQKLEPGKDISNMKRLGGGSSLVYKFIKDGETVAAFKPFQKRYQSNYRSEIAAYRLCPVMKCGFDVPVNLPVYFDFKEFSSLYARNAANPKEEFAEIIPTKLEDGTYRVDGTYKYWIKEFGEYPIEFKIFWTKWLNPGTTKEDLQKPASNLLNDFAKQHKRGDKFVEKLAPHFENLSIYNLARQISNMLVFDFLINNWDRFSGAPQLYGVNCQFANGRIMSIDNGAGFSQTPHEKPAKHLHEITRFSRLTYEAIKNFDKEEISNYLFPNATEFEQEKLETFWKLRESYLNYVAKCIEKNGEAETFFFE